MDSFHHSRGRILFDALCAFGLSASLVGAWQQTYASALLGAAGFAGLFGLVRAFDVVRRRPAAVVDLAVEPAAEGQGDLLTYVAAEPDLPEYLAADEAGREPAQPVDRSEADASGVAKKPSRKRSKRPIEVLAAAETEAAAEAAPEIAVSVAELRPADPMPAEPPSHPPIAPLFEAEPFVRQQRAAFGRKAG